MSESQYRIERNTKEAERQYFIDRYGKIHKYSGSMEVEIISFHYEIAHTLMPSLTHPKDTLMKLGWCMVGSVCYHNPIIEKQPSQSQINTLDRENLLSYLLIRNGNVYEKYNSK